MTEKTALFEIVDGDVIVTTSTGWKVKCLPFGDDLMRAGTALTLPEKPEPPTYLLGDPEEGERNIYVPYTDVSIEDSSVPAEDTEAWGKYVVLRQEHNAQVAIIQSQQSLMKSRVMIYRATQILDIPDLDAWAEERENFYGIPSPKSEREFLFQFFTTEVAKTDEDVLSLMAGIMRATGATEEVLDQFEATFRAEVGPSQGKDAQADPEGTAAAA